MANSLLRMVNSLLRMVNSLLNGGGHSLRLSCSAHRHFWPLATAQTPPGAAAAAHIDARDSPTEARSDGREKIRSAPRRSDGRSSARAVVVRRPRRSDGRSTAARAVVVQRMRRSNGRSSARAARSATHVARRYVADKREEVHPGAKEAKAKPATRWRRTAASTSKSPSPAGNSPPRWVDSSTTSSSSYSGGCNTRTTLRVFRPPPEVVKKVRASLRSRRVKLASEREKLASEREKLASERVELASERVYLASERVYLASERVNLASGRVGTLDFGHSVIRSLWVKKQAVVQTVLQSHQNEAATMVAVAMSPNTTNPTGSSRSSRSW
eukprot:1177649-Prorocentrum_minimum.AAC.2